MTYDKDFKGHVTEDDTMETLFLRYGRNQIDSEMRKLFGDKLQSAGGEGVLSLDDYLKVVSVRQVKKPTVASDPAKTV